MLKDGGGVVLIYTTMPDSDAADRLATTLIEEKVAACVNIIPGMTSVYAWQGKLERTSETVCLVKTTRHKSALTMERIGQLHPYETPAILQLEADAAATAFGQWVATQTAS